MLAPGTLVEMEGGRCGVVGRLLGRGAQGVVCELQDPVGSLYALKWYEAARPEQHRLLSYLIEKGAPSDRFLWPLGLARLPGRDSFGYLMRLRPDGYVELGALLSGEARASFAATIRLCFELARSFLRLHSLGLCYRDLSFGNVFFRPDTGEVLVCDNDNVGVDDGQPAGVIGTASFMAPEVVRRDAYPSARTDLHSLAVMLFYILMVGHPLEGRKTDHGCFDAEWQLEHYGTDPVFAFDPGDDRNRPTGDQATGLYWPLYPGFLHRLFTDAFTKGLADPDARVREGQWAKAMLRLRDSLTQCLSCRRTIFFDWDAPDRPCGRCGATEPIPLSLRIGHHRLVVSPVTRVFSDHLGANPETAVLIGEMTSHPRDPNRLGIRNLTGEPWSATGPDGRIHEVPAGRSIECLPDVRIHFPGGEGAIEAPAFDGGGTRGARP